MGCKNLSRANGMCTGSALALLCPHPIPCPPESICDRRRRAWDRVRAKHLSITHKDMVLDSQKRHLFTVRQLEYGRIATGVRAYRNWSTGVSQLEYDRIAIGIRCMNTAFSPPKVAISSCRSTLSYPRACVAVRGWPRPTGYPPVHGYRSGWSADFHGRAPWR